MSDDEAHREYTWNLRAQNWRSAPRFVRAKHQTETLNASIPSSSRNNEATEVDPASWYRSMLDSRASSTEQNTPNETPVASTSASAGPSRSASPSVVAATTTTPESSSQDPSSPSFCELCQSSFTLPLAAHQRSLGHILKRDASTPVQLPTYYQLGSQTVGYQALQRAGWKDSERGLGAEEQGGKAPLRAVEKKDKLGIGLKKVDRPLREKRKMLDHQETLRKAKKDKESFKRLYAQVKGTDVEWNKMYS